MHKHILITGATGFLGKPLCTALQQNGYQVTAVNRSLQPGPWDQQYVFDLQSPRIDPELLSGIDTVIHLAGIAHDTGFSQAEYTQINVRGTLSLALMSIGANVDRFIYVSSRRVAAVIEGADSADAYAHSKYDAELGLRKISAEQHMRLTIIRPSLVYGTGVKGNLEQMLNAIQQSWFPPLPESEGGISMVAAEDVASALIAILENDNTIGKTYSLDDGEVYNPRRIYTETRNQLQRSIPAWSVPMSWLEIAAKIGDLADRKGIHLPLSSLVLAKMFANTASHCDALNKDTGWQPAKILKDLLPDIL